MSTQTQINEPAEPIAKGIIPTAKQAFGDLFKWKQRVEVVNEYGEARTEWQSPPAFANPFAPITQLSFRAWVFFLAGFIAWVADAYDFHALSIQTTKLSTYFHTTNTKISEAITFTLLLRSVGAAFFGFAGDKFGRKWPMVLNMFVLGLLQIGSIYAQNFQQFLAVRALFGIFMGGVYGNAIAMALENCPVAARGIMSGTLQAGYSVGYVLAACTNLGVGASPQSFKTVFWCGAGISFFSGLLRCCFPESQQFIDAKKAKALAKENNIQGPSFMDDVKAMLKKHWKMCVYCIFLMTWFNYYSHSSQDSYTTFMITAKGLNNAAASRASIWMKTGAIFGGVINASLSQWVGRRRTIILCAFMSLVLIPAWVLPKGEKALSATGFLIQFFIQGAWGVIPIHLNELAPPAFRSSFVGVTYQLGNMISSPSTQIVNEIASTHLVNGPVKGKKVPSYGATMGVMTAIIAMGIILTIMVGPEKRGSRFEQSRAAGAAELHEQPKTFMDDDDEERKVSTVQVEHTPKH